MAITKVPLWNALARFVTIDTEATVGATVGSNVYNADGSLFVPETGTAVTVKGGASILVSGSANYRVLLVNDVINPGNTYYYGTGPTGIKGWATIASAFTAAQPGIELVTGADGVTDIRPDDDLEALEAIGTTGIAARTAANTWVTRIFQAGAGMSGSNLDGIAGDPTYIHGDTSSVANLTSDNSGTVVIQDLAITFDTFGHVQTATVGTVDVAAALGGTFQPLDSDLTALANNSTNGLWARTGSGAGAARTFQAGAGLTGSNLDGVAGDPTYFHADTSSASDLSSDNANGVVLQDISLTFDTFGHVTGATVGTVDLDARFQPSDATLSSLAALTDPNVDAIVFWDDSAGNYANLSVGNGLKISGTTISAGESGTEDSTTFLRGDGVWTNTLTGTLTASNTITASGGNPAYFLAVSTGNIQLAMSANDTLGLAFIGTLTAHQLDLSASSTGIMSLDASTLSAKPHTNNARDLGTSASRWKTTFTHDLVVGRNVASFGGGADVFFVSNAVTNPTSNPTGGGILYADAGAGKWRGSGGTTTTFGPADPHCLECGRDHVLEAENDSGWYQAICLHCLADKLTELGLDKLSGKENSFICREKWKWSRHKKGESK